MTEKSLKLLSFTTSKSNVFEGDRLLGHYVFFFFLPFRALTNLFGKIKTHQMQVKRMEIWIGQLFSKSWIHLLPGGTLPIMWGIGALCSHLC